VRVRDEIAAAKHQKYLALLDSLPEVLENLALLFDKDRSWDECLKGAELGKYHGRQRYSLKSYSVLQVLTEFQVLREVIFDVMSNEIKFDFQLIRRIITYTDHCLASAVGSFNYEERHEERREFAKLQEERNESDANLQLREQFLAAISHDLRNPIATAKLALTLLNHNLPITREIEELVMILSRSLDRAETIVNDLLDINLVRSGRRILLNIVKVDLIQLGRELLQDFVSTYGERLVLEADDQIIGYWCPNNLRRIFENLLSNALKYGDKKLPVTIRLKKTQSHVTISVHNFGPALAPGEQDALFEPFVRLRSNPPTENTDVGWGLGLAVVRAVAEAHGGHVMVVSNENEGTTFVVKLLLDSRPFQAEIK